MLDSLLDIVDVSFKWVLLAFNFLTIIFVYIYQKNNKRVKQHHILFLIAHPDDQCMFFRPTISNLNEKYFMHLLCMSGKGTSRQEQLVNACKKLKIDHVSCIGDDKLVDGMKEKWCEETIRKYVLQYIKQNSIKAVFTFDKNGVSDHINHKALHSAMKQIETQENKPEQSIKIYYLESVSLLRKYLGLVELPIALLQTFSWIEFSPIKGYLAMSEHKSQFVWYRKLWVFLSRYQYINTYKRALITLKQKQQ